MSTEAPTLNDIAPGTILAGKYRVERILGQGGMGIVVEARHLALDERVALKFLLPEYATHPEASARFLREARAAAKIKNEHVARVTDHGTLENGSPYMVMEFLEGRDLSKQLEVQGVLSVEDALDYLIQGCDAIAEAHAVGIVHRDIKPANLFLTKRANGSALVKVLDFGISKTTGGGMDNLTKTTAAMGSALYMSPEQMQATKGVDHRTDIYALGISLYELLAGKQPFVADTLPALCAEVFTGTPTPIRTLRQDVPEELAAVLEKAYARDRGHRFQSVAEFVLALAPFAPARSRGTIESVAKLAGLDVPPPGAPPVPLAQPRPPQNGGTIPMPVVAGPDPTARQSVPSQPGVPQTTGSPVTVAATAAAPKPSSKGAVLILGGLGFAIVASAAAFFALRPGASAVKPATAAPPETAVTAAAPAPPSAAPQAPSAVPAAPTTTAVASAEPTAAAAATAKPTDVGRPKVGGTQAATRTVTATTAAPAPKPAAGKPDRTGF